MEETIQSRYQDGCRIAGPVEQGICQLIILIKNVASVPHMAQYTPIDKQQYVKL